jgi:hypothetical protein
MEAKVKEESRGYVGMVRYADDFVICVQYKTTRAAYSPGCGKGRKFGLELAEEKTAHRVRQVCQTNAEAKGAQARVLRLPRLHAPHRPRRGASVQGREKDKRKKLNANSGNDAVAQRRKELLTLKDCGRR